nr:C2 calcium-dependent membrane targeting [Tanacetum cinerariifolium]
MVLGKLWKVYRGGLENWVVGLLQPVIDNLQKPDYVERVEIKQFSLGNELLSVRHVERRTSRRINVLPYQIGLRYTGGARMLLMLSLKFGIIPIKVPVGTAETLNRRFPDSVSQREKMSRRLPLEYIHLGRCT